jgi:hypothetical protein
MLVLQCTSLLVYNSLTSHCTFLVYNSFTSLKLVYNIVFININIDIVYNKLVTEWRMTLNP